jgi:hypothetical protein
VRLLPVDLGVPLLYDHGVDALLVGMLRVVVCFLIGAVASDRLDASGTGNVSHVRSGVLAQAVHHEGPLALLGEAQPDQVAMDRLAQHVVPFVEVVKLQRG